MLKNVLTNATTKLENNKTAQTRARDKEQFSNNLAKVLQTSNNLVRLLNTALAAEQRQLLVISVDSIMRNDIVASLRAILEQVHEGYLETTSVQGITNNFTALKRQIDSRWIASVSGSTEQVVTLLKTFRQFMANESEATSVIQTLEEWIRNLPPSPEEVATFSSQLKRGYDLGQKIGADNDIQEFIQKVLDKQATLADVTDKVQAWIVEHGLETRMRVQLA